MKKIIFTATALLAIASGTYSIYANNEDGKHQKDWHIENIRDYRENNQSNYEKKKLIRVK